MEYSVRYLPMLTSSHRYYYTCYAGRYHFAMCAVPQPPAYKTSNYCATLRYSAPYPVNPVPELSACLRTSHEENADRTNPSLSTPSPSQHVLFSRIASPMGFPPTNPSFSPPSWNTLWPLTHVSWTRPRKVWPSQGEQRFFHRMSDLCSVHTC